MLRQQALDEAEQMKNKVSQHSGHPFGAHLFKLFDELFWPLCPSQQRVLVLATLSADPAMSVICLACCSCACILAVCTRQCVRFMLLPSASPAQDCVENCFQHFHVHFNTSLSRKGRRPWFLAFCMMLSSVPFIAQ